MLPCSLLGTSKLASQVAILFSEGVHLLQEEVVIKFRLVPRRTGSARLNISVFLLSRM